MADDKGQDEKVICVPVSDPIWNSLNDLSDMNTPIKRNRTFLPGV
jgi:inorganic pyrophosphatase